MANNPNDDPTQNNAAILHEPVYTTPGASGLPAGVAAALQIPQAAITNENTKAANVASMGRDGQTHIINTYGYAASSNTNWSSSTEHPADAGGS